MVPIGLKLIVELNLCVLIYSMSYTSCGKNVYYKMISLQNHLESFQRQLTTIMTKSKSW